jgi:Zn-dependent peptidase ImmA (M78 family)
VRGKVSNWTNASVRLLAGQDDPVDAVLKRARDVVLRAMDQGWTGPPFDPIRLSELLSIPIWPRADIRDARTVPQGESAVCIEYNPTRPRGRLRYSIAHEIAHTLFPDCADRIRNRAIYHELQGDEWQLEVLCNVAAAEFLMPIGSLEPQLLDQLTIDHVLTLRSQFNVSTEAILIRTAHVANVPCTSFVASRIDQGPREGQYRVDYAIASRSWTKKIPSGFLLSPKSVVQQCTAIGYTAKSDEVLSVLGEQTHLECVGIPPYPGRFYPRVAGLITGARVTQERAGITYLKGNAVEPAGSNRKVIVHVVSDATPNWGGMGFAVALKRKWPQAQSDFRNWAQADRRHLKLGQVRVVSVSQDIFIVSIVSQRGYGPSVKPRIRYLALEEGLSKVASVAKDLHATVHMPRIGCGQAGGAWFIVQELIASSLLNADIPVFVYDLPEGQATRPLQAVLDLSMV